MLILTRKINQSIVFQSRDLSIEIQICNVRGKEVRVGITAPPSVDIFRKELLNKKLKDDQILDGNKN